MLMINNYKNFSLLIFLLFSTNAIHAKRVGSAQPQVAQPRVQQPPAQPVTQPRLVVTAPIAPKPAISSDQPAIIQPKSYAQALDYIKAQKQTFPIIINNALTKEFINFVKSLNLSPIET